MSMTEHEVKIAPYRNAPTLFIDGEAQNFTTFKINENPDLKMMLESAGNEMPGIAEQDIDLCFVPIFIDWKGPGEYDFSDMDARINAVIREYAAGAGPDTPEIKIVIRIQAAVFLPEWYLRGNMVDGEYTNKIRFNNFWGRSEPVEVQWEQHFATRNPGYGEPFAISPCDRFWDTYAIDCLKAIVEHAKSQPYHEKVFGYLHCALSTNEYFLHSDSPNSCCDFSVPTQRRFHEYLLKKAHTTSCLPVPTPHEVFDKRSLFLDPSDETESRIEEFSLFLNDRVADIIANFSQTIKSMYPEKNKLVGCFYGYTMELSPIYNLSQCGHIASRRLMKNPDIDFFCCPLQYRYRADNGDFTFCQLLGAFADSMKLHGKLAFGEDDHVVSSFHDLSSRDPWHDEMFFRRNFAAIATHGQNMWWYSLGANWFADAGRRRIIGELHKIAGELMKRDRSGAAEVACVIDERSISAIRPNPDFWRKTLLDTVANLYPAGTQFDIFELETFLEKADHARYKVVIFPNLFLLDEATLAKVRKLRSAGRTLIFMEFPGVMRDDAEGKRTISSQNASELIGMAMRFSDEGPGDANIASGSGMAGMPVSFSGKLNNVLWLDPERDLLLDGTTDLRFGHAAIYEKLLRVEDETAEKLAYHCDGSVGMARKKFADHTTVFISAPEVPAVIMRKLFTDAGVHCYAECGDVFYINASLAAYVSSSYGEKVMTFPAPETLTDVFTGETLSTGEDLRIRLKLKRHETRLFYRSTR